MLGEHCESSQMSQSNSSDGLVPDAIGKYIFRFVPHFAKYFALCFSVAVASAHADMILHQIGAEEVLWHLLLCCACKLS